jgi:hypothetical protein
MTKGISSKRYSNNKKDQPLSFPSSPALTQFIYITKAWYDKENGMFHYELTKAVESGREEEQ